MRILLIGAGQLGSEIAAQCQLALPQAHLSLIKRQPSSLPYQQYYVDVTDRDALNNSEVVNQHYQHVIYCLSPNARTVEAYEKTFIQGLQSVLEQISYVKFWFISSTAVYPQSNAAWVDEQTPCEPTQFNGQVLRRAEQIIANRADEYCILRLSGIYGGKRRSLLKLVQTGAMPDKDSWSNRIHQLDAARALVFLMGQSNCQRLYNISDSQPVLLSDVVTYLRQQLKVEQHLPWPRALSIGKKISNQRLRDAGFEFVYGNYQQGYSVMLQNLTDEI